MAAMVALICVLPPNHWSRSHSPTGKHGTEQAPIALCVAVSAADDTKFAHNMCWAGVSCPKSLHKTHCMLFQCHSLYNKQLSTQTSGVDHNTPSSRGVAMSI